MVGTAPVGSRASESAIVASGVKKTYASRSGPIEALAGIDLVVRRGEFVSLLGPSGCGKSTLLSIVAGLSEASAGTVTVGGVPVCRPQTQLGVVFQTPVLLEWRDVLGNVLLQAEAHGLDRAAATVRARELLASVGLAGFEHRRPSELSGGMQQRVAICRALLHDPDIVLLDEPFGALDALTRDQMAIDFQRLWSLGDKTALFVTHSIAEAVFLSDRVVVLSPRPGEVDLDLAINIERPRRLHTRELPEFSDHTRAIRDAFLRRGVLRDDP
jgi:NitT/TauT family transport system ATP-binding protein